MPDETELPCHVRRFTLGDGDAVREIFRESPQAGALTKDSYERLPEWSGPLALVSVSRGEVTGLLMGREVADEAEALPLPWHQSTDGRDMEER